MMVMCSCKEKNVFAPFNSEDKEGEGDLEGVDGGWVAHAYIN